MREGLFFAPRSRWLLGLSVVLIATLAKALFNVTIHPLDDLHRFCKEYACFPLVEDLANALVFCLCGLCG